MNRILIVALGILALVCAIQFGLSRYKAAEYGRAQLELTKATDALRASESARKRAERGLALQAKKNAATAQETASARASLHAAKASSPSWASETVPEAVRETFK